MLNVLYGGSRFATEALVNATAQLNRQVPKQDLQIPSSVDGCQEDYIIKEIIWLYTNSTMATRFAAP